MANTIRLFLINGIIIEGNEENFKLTKRGIIVYCGDIIDGSISNLCYCNQRIAKFEEI